jgi:acetyltransferase-like isoleucine patch superfamily enzyme
MARNFFQKIGYKALKYVLPEIVVLRKNLSWDILGKNIEKTIVGNNVNIGEPANISESKIGDYSYIAMNSMISLTEIGKFCSIGPNLLCGWGIHPTNGISTAPMFYSTMKQNGVTLSDRDKIDERKPILIGNDVFIGANVTILDGVKIGDGAVIGAGAVVSKDIPPYAIAVGTPIRIVKYRFEQEQIDKLLSFQWWNFDRDKLKSVEEMFFQIEEFIDKHYTS